MSIKVKAWFDPRKALKQKIAAYGNVEIEIDERGISDFSDEETELLAEVLEAEDHVLGKGFWLSPEGEIFLSPKDLSWKRCDDEPLAGVTATAIRDLFSARIAAAKAYLADKEAQATAVREAAMKKLSGVRTQAFDKLFALGPASIVTGSGSGHAVAVPPGGDDPRLADFIEAAMQIAAADNERVLGSQVTR